MLKSNLHPPHDGLNADPILYGVAAGLAELFPVVEPPQRQKPQANRVLDGRHDGPHEATDDE